MQKQTAESGLTYLLLLLVASKAKRQRGTLTRSKYVHMSVCYTYNYFSWHTHMRAIQMFADAISAFQIYTHVYWCPHCVRVGLRARQC